MVLTDNVATLIHDLKTPISAQERVLELLLKNNFGELTETQAEIISQIKESCQYLKSIICTAMNCYRTNNVKLEAKLEYFDFKDLLFSILKEVEPLTKDKMLDFNINCDEIILHADKFQIKRVIYNLISNAIKYSFLNTKIEISMSNTDNNFLFKIKNAAPKIPNIDNVFDKFESTTNSGLGLYLVKKVIELHKGSVFAKEETDGKYSFGFVIPNV